MPRSFGLSPWIGPLRAGAGLAHSMLVWAPWPYVWPWYTNLFIHSGSTGQSPVNVPLYDSFLGHPWGPEELSVLGGRPADGMFACALLRADIALQYFMLRHTSHSDTTHRPVGFTEHATIAAKAFQKDCRPRLLSSSYQYTYHPASSAGNTYMLEDTLYALRQAI